MPRKRSSDRRFAQASPGVAPPTSLAALRAEGAGALPGMFSRWNLAFFVLAFVAFSSGMVFSRQVQVQIAPGIFQPGGGESGMESGVELPRDPELNKRLEAAADYLREKDWAKGVGILQRLVETGEDVFIRLNPDLVKSLGEALPGFSVQGKDLSIRALAGRMIASLPKDAREIYQAAYGQTATNQLKEAREKGDLEQLSNVFRSFLHTDAGRQAAALLASFHLDRGDPLAAALCFERLFQSDPRNEASLPESIWLKGALAFRMAGDKPGEDLLWKRMEERGLRDLALQGKKRSLQELKNQVASGGAKPTGSLLDWEMVGGDASRNATVQGGVPFLEPNWKAEPTVLERIFIPLPDRATVSLPLSTGINTAEKLAELERNLGQDRNQAVIPAQQPLALDIGSQENRTALAVYRSHGGLVARNMKTGAIHWANPIDWSIDRMANGSLLSKPKHRDALDSWLTGYMSGNMNGMSVSGNPSVVFENSTVGTISSDGQRVFTVVDFEVPPAFASSFNGFPMGGPMEGPASMFNRFGSDVTDAVMQNRIESYHLVTGKLLWRLGGRDGAPNGELSESLFLGAPLPLGDRLFVLNEKQQELRLVTVDAATGRLLGIQRLCTVRDRAQQDILRRTSAAHLAYADGILICPTNAGVVMGVELLTRSFVWAYSYRDSNENGPTAGGNMGGFPGAMPPPIRGGRPMMPRIPNPGMGTQPTNAGGWKSTPPRIAEGRLVFTSPDSQSVVCLGLKDGGQQWKVRREEGDLYVAGVTQGKVIVVGKKQVRALDLRDGGKKLWAVDTGMPSGYGSVAGSQLYLPLRGNESSKQPEVCVIDLQKGQIASRTKSRKTAPVGNLVFHDGEMVSVTSDQVTSFPLLSAKLAQIDSRIMANPNDPVGLMERGQMRLDKGDWAGAVDDLTRSIQGKPGPDVLSKARENLHEAFVEYFGRDFAKAEPFLQAFEATCTMEVPAQADAKTLEMIRKEEKKRKSVYLRLLARGREAQGKVLEAFDTYLQIAAMGMDGDLDAVPEEAGLKATPDVWARGRIAAMVEKAAVNSRGELEKKVASRWEAMKSAKAPIGEMRKFAQVFGSLLESGRVAQIELARRFASDGSAAGFLQAEQDWISLRQSARTPVQTGEALLALSDLYLEKGLAADAAECLKDLGATCAEALVDGRTGAQWLALAWTDHRLSPFLSGQSRWFANGPVKALPVESSPGNNPRYNQAINLKLDGESLPYFRGMKLTLQFATGRSNFNQFRMVDSETGAEVLSETLSRENLIGQPQAAQLLLGGGVNAPRLKFQTRGHLVLVEALNAVSVLDAVQKHESTRHELWSLNLHNPREAAGQTTSQITSVTPLEKSPGAHMVQFLDWKFPLGEAAVLGDGVVALLTKDGLMAVDPVTGRKMWLREDVRGDSRVHAMGGNLLVVEMDTDGSPKATRMVRAADGVVVPSTDLAQAYRRKLQVSDSALIHTRELPSGGMEVIASGPSGGKEFWKLEIPAGVRFAEDEQPGVLSWVEPDGKFRRVSIETGRDILSARVDTVHAQGANPKVFADADKLYLLLDKPSAPGAMVSTNFNTATSVRQVGANGELYAFDRATGKTAWRVSAKNQLLVTENFENLPIILFASRYTKPGNGNARQNVGAFLSIDKKTGKRLMDEERPNLQQFQNFKVDPKRGRIELEAPGTRIVHQVTGPGGK